MQALRLHDPGRRPARWTDIIRSSQFAAFSKDFITGAPCDPDGRPFMDQDEVACLVFDSLAEARAFCEAAVLKVPAVGFEIFDAAGRAHPPLLTIVHPSRAGHAESDPAIMRRRRVIAWSLIACAIPTLLFAYVLRDGGHQIFAGFVGLNMLVAAGRLLWFNLAIRETEQVRQERMAAATRRGRDDR